ncbi:rhomboid-domain-containing protein [Parathielavia hyrcaniae]|uniref:Rhomboid-type serine protease n=1 Tax=Parathielavia hyrcaniae TaxID=113614 RepID=A0AAN6Q7V1_9PEZI|nr:rhomboid-domain-containing protein [Parathielavia hyrcaniae]
MAANDYYNQKPLPDATIPPYPGYYSGYPTSSSSSTPAPPYSSQPNLVPGGRPPQGLAPSPFETVFDDHVYPASTHQPTPASSTHRLSHQDTGYHGHTPVSPDDTSYNRPTDDIPLQDHPQRHPSKDAEMQDHVYDAPQAKKSRRGRVRFGELGMLASGRRKIPFVVYFFTIVQVAVFIGEIVKNSMETGSPIMTQPSFNPMIGPSPYILVNMGARFVPCMHNVAGIQNANRTIPWPCPSSKSLDSTLPENQCTLSDLCGFGGVPEPAYNPNTPLTVKPAPNQWFRFIVPIFLHAGLIHIGFNMLLQLTLGRDMEKSIGSIRFFLVYMSAGIFGFVMGGNFAATGIASTGASGSLFGVIALTLLDLLYSWKDRAKPAKDLAFIILDVVISFVLGLLPGLDNFSHIGGFLMGLGLGVCLLHSPNSLRRRIGDDDAPYATERVSGGFAAQGTPPSFLKNPVGFFKGRMPLWWAWWLIRAGALAAVTVVFILLLNNFYVTRATCGWCKYLSCLPVSNWCDIGNLQL